MSQNTQAGFGFAAANGLGVGTVQNEKTFLSKLKKLYRRKAKTSAGAFLLHATLWGTGITALYFIYIK